jgi:hypothetical protein
MAATRLRKTFHYPTESDDEDAVEQGMDEQGKYLLLASDAHITTCLTHFLLYQSPKH